MKGLKCSVTVLAALVVAASIYGQNSGKAKKKSVKPTKVGASRSGASSFNSSSSMGAASALPMTDRGRAERNAAYAPSNAFRKQAMSLYQAGDLTGAEEACLNALNAVPVIKGQPQHVPLVAELLGQIYLKDGQYDKAIQWLQTARPNTASGSLDLNLALAYLRRGDYKHARAFYSDQAILRFYSEGSSHDLPGTNTPNTLEASILLARGLDAYLEDRNDDALPDLQDANRLAPNNALIAYHCARILSEKGRFAEAAPLYKRAAATGHGIISEDAKRRSAGM